MDDIFSEIHEFINDPNNQPEDEYKLLTKEQYDTLIESFIESRGAEYVTLDETMKVVRWAEEAIINYELLQLLLKGLTAVDIRDDGELVFSAL